MKKSLVYDVSLKDEEEQGHPILFTNQDIRKMLNLANVNEEDIFYDLGCGYGQNIKIALTEFNVKKAIGFENNLERNKIAKNRLKALKQVNIEKSRWEVYDHDFDDILKNKIKNMSIDDATVVFYGLSTDKSLLDKMRKMLNKGCRLICYYGCLFPEIMPEKSDFPFYLHICPFKKCTGEYDWLNAVIKKKKSIFKNKTKPTKQELWDELKHDYDVYADPDDVDEYQKRIKKVLKKSSR